MLFLRCELFKFVLFISVVFILPSNTSTSRYTHGPDVSLGVDSGHGRMQVVSCPILGTTKIKNMKQNVRALSIKLTLQQMTLLESYAIHNLMQTWKEYETPDISSWGW